MLVSSLIQVIFIFSLTIMAIQFSKGHLCHLRRESFYQESSIQALILGKKHINKRKIICGDLVKMDKNGEFFKLKRNQRILKQERWKRELPPLPKRQRTF